MTDHTKHDTWCDEQALEDFDEGQCALMVAVESLHREFTSWDGITPSEALAALDRIEQAVHFIRQAAVSAGGHPASATGSRRQA